MAAQSRLRKFEFFFKILFVVAANVFWLRLRSSVFGFYFWLRLTGVDAWPPVIHSYHIHHLRIHSHTTQPSSNPSLHLSTSSNATFSGFFVY